jgi:hypothetical protein
MDSLVLSILLAALLAVPVPQEVPKAPEKSTLEKAFITEDSFSYKGYLIRRVFEKSKEDTVDESRIDVMHGNKRLATMSGCCYKESAQYAVVSLLGKGSKQLVVETYAGGGHCCTSYDVYDLTIPLHKLFGDDYSNEDVGYSMRLIDIDKDGKMEFVQSIMNFDYFWNSHARSVFPEVVFAYDAAARKYLPTNRRFTSYLLRDINEKKRLVDKLNADAQSLSRIIGGRRSAKTLEDEWLSEDYFNSTVDVTLTYIYAGQRDEGWTYFDQNYRLQDKQQLRIAILDTLRDSDIYNFIYRKRRHAR